MSSLRNQIDLKADLRRQNNLLVTKKTRDVKRSRQKNKEKKDQERTLSDMWHATGKKYMDRKGQKVNLGQRG